MGAMSSPSHWIPEDDFLLKSAIEAGASLESLAKGAVQFSRRFTVEELRDRWFSLLYDPVVSAEASPQMVVLEHSAFSNQSRPNYKVECVKEMACSSGKRKAESVWKCYCAMRKRICNEPFDLMGINLLSGPVYSNSGDGNELLSADCRIVHPVSNDLGIQAPDFGITHQSFPVFGPHSAESTGNGATPSFSGVQNHDQGLHFGGKNVSHNLSYPYEVDISLTEDCSEVPGFGQSKELPFCNLFETGGLVNEEGACSEYGDLQFRSFECSLPEAQIWQTSQEISAAGLPGQIGEKQTRDAFIITQAGRANETESLGHAAGHSNSNFEAPLSCDSMIDVTPSTEDYFAELSNTLFDFTNDDELFMDTDGKDTINNSYFNNLGLLLMDSPNQCELPSAGLRESVQAADARLGDTSGAHTGRPDNKELNLCYQPKVPDPQVASFVSNMKGFGPVYRNGAICCTLNTEDQEIPSNDDVFLPYRFPSPTNSSGGYWRLHEPSYQASSSAMDSLSTRKANRGPPMIRNNQKASCVPSHKIGSSEPSVMGLGFSIGDKGVKFELPESNIQHAAFRIARNSECANLVSSANINNFPAGVGMGGAIEMGQEKNIDDESHGPCPDKQKSTLDIIQSVQRNASGSMSGLEAKSQIPNYVPSNVGLSFQQTVPEPIDQSLLLDQDELRFKNEFDVPYFSDVETMILDMDLSPDEFDLFTTPEVKRYQNEETKRTIIRLEQAADAFTHRSMAAQDAFAVLYGRSSKHFITKPEVVLGRETEDVKVDIDLGREKNGGKISRKQAIIRMDMRGVFRLKNIGKGSMQVNGREVATGQSLSLPPGSLLEVKGLTFVFETDPRNIKQYVESMVGGWPSVEHEPLNRDGQGANLYP